MSILLINIKNKIVKGVSISAAPTSQRDKTVSWINIAKGIAMLSVILTHVGLIPWTQYLHTFMLPLFAILSGYLIPTSTPTWSSFLTKKGLRLLVPYFFIGLISLLYWQIFLHNLPVFSEFIQPTSDLVLALLTGHDIVFNGPLWYLLALFLAFIWWRMSAWANRHTAELSFIFLISGYVFSRLIGERRLYVALPLSLFLAGYLHLGYLLKKNQVYLMKIPVWAAVLTFVIVTSINGSVNFYALTLGNPVFFFLGSLSGSLIVIHLSTALQNYLHTPAARFCSYCGERSLALLLWHWPLLLTLNALLSIYGIFAFFGGTPSLVHCSLPPRTDPLSLFVRSIFFIVYFNWAVLGSLILDFIFRKRRYLARI